MAKRSKKSVQRWFYTLLILVGLFALALIILEQDLPDVDTLKNVQMQVPLRVYTADHKLIAEYGEMRRIPVQLNQVPKQLIQAIIATEDKRFWEHSGVDILGLGRAAVQLAVTGRKTQGGSTITMQVARNFFLTRKKTYIRKLREILLALKIDHELAKKKILWLYLNKVYLGYRAYGFAAAARVYYGKPLNQLTLPQLAILAGLPKAPSAINPITNPDRAKDRRDHVLYNMYEQHYIDKATYEQARNVPITATYHRLPIEVQAPYLAEMVRNAMVRQYGKKAYGMGLVVTTTVNSKLQQAANKAVQKTLLAYTKRHGYRGPVANWGLPPVTDADVNTDADTDNANPENNTQSPYTAWLKKLKTLPTVANLMPSVILSVADQQATALTRDGQQVTVPWRGITWAGKALINGWKAPAPTTAGKVLKIGDVVYLQPLKNQQWALAQIPQAQGALVSLNPNNGGINAVVGGFDFHYSKFNRATDALRQPGSGFKPFVYSAALAKGYTLASIVNDAPIVTDAANEAGIWRPQNDNLTFAGPTRLRVGLMKSRNLVSIRLLQLIGIPYAINYIQKLGFDPNQLPKNLTLALGAGDITPLQLAAGFAIFANGGYRVNPYFIQQVADNDNGQKILFQAQPKIACKACANQDANDNNKNLAPRVVTPQNAYLITSAMQSVIQSGTGRAAKVLGRSDLAGKTGTTNDQRDAWFSGFDSNIVTVCWVGFDQPRSTYEYGSRAALPMWIDFMRQALRGKPEDTMPRPADMVTVKIDPKTGLRARPGQANAIFETFRREYVPTTTAPSAAASQNDVVTQASNITNNSNNNSTNTNSQNQQPNMPQNATNNANDIAPQPTNNATDDSNNNNGNDNQGSNGQPLF